jgi:hypothetical protein
MRKAMTGAGAGDPDVQAIMGDTYFNSLMHFDNLTSTDQAKLTREHPETVDLAEVIDDARYDVHDLTRWVDDPVRRYIDDYVIPMMTIASCFIPGTQGVTVPRALAVAVPRLVPLLGRIATAYGAEEIYRRVTTFFNEQFKDESKNSSSSSPDRGQTPAPHSQAPYTKPGGEKLADGFKQNLNRLNEPRETIVYAIKDHTGKIMKYGETAAGYFESEGMKDVLKRPYRQIMQAAKRGDTSKYIYTEVKKFSSKKEARAFETQKIDQAKLVDPKACPWNKGRH